jgi:predicted ATPase
MNKYVITGPGHSGKTAVVSALVKRGYSTVQEAATDFILDYKKQTNGGKPQADCINLLEILIFLEQNKRENEVMGDVVILDRGINDILAYINYKSIDLNLAEEQSNELIKNGITTLYGYNLAEIDFKNTIKQMNITFNDANRYEKKVFLLEQVPDIRTFEEDEIRTSTPETRAELTPFIRDVYQNAGYDVIDLPVIDGEKEFAVSKRVDLILAELGI